MWVGGGGSPTEATTELGMAVGQGMMTRCVLKHAWPTQCRGTSLLAGAQQLPLLLIAPPREAVPKALRLQAAGPLALCSGHTVRWHHSSLAAKG